MRFILIFLTLFSSQVFANSTLLVNSGWQLIGLNTSVENLDLFKAKNVEQVWYFSAKSQKWLGYSPDKFVQKKIDDKDFGKIESLKSWHGFWIKSKQDWMLTLEDTDANKSVPEDNNISLEIGWNLISLPINSAVSPYIFDDVSIWKYTHNEWKFFGEDEENQDFPTISHISNSDGIWVKSDKKQTLSVSNNSSRLHSFENMEQVKAYIKDMILINDRPYFGYHPMLQVGGIADNVMFSPVAEDAKTSDKGVDNATGTNLQESDVDESDILKHDGKNIFYVDGKNVNITTFSRILSGEKKPLKVMALDAGKNVNSLYLVDDKLVVLSSVNDYNIQTKSRLSMPYYSGKAKMSVDTYSVKDIQNIDKIGSFVIDGSIKDSRVVDGKLILISTFNPYLKKEYPKIYAGVSDCKNYDYNKRIAAKCYGVFKDNDGRFYRYDYKNPTIISENLVPMIEKNGDKNVSLLIPSTFYVPAKKNQEYSITTVSKIDIKEMKLEDTSSILGYQSAVYASSKALYLVSDKYPVYYDFNNYKHRSAIYKFQIGDELIYKGMGFVGGKALNQFSLSEYDDVLRIATTEGRSWGGGETKNSVFTLQERDGILEQLGYLGGLGKKGERIYSVRFMGDKGYVVTFFETDPFYTLDLSDPANPLKIGELEIEGFSSYLHPIGDDLIMGVGRDANRKLKLELFDISDFSKPDSVDEYVFDTKGHFSSELERNHKALAFRKSDNLFTVPFSGGDYRLNNYGNYLGVFKVEDNQFKVYDNIVDDFSSNRYASLNRGIIFDKDEETYVAYLVNGLATFKTLTSLEKE